MGMQLRPSVSSVFEQITDISRTATPGDEHLIARISKGSTTAKLG
jgi:hypothetical protein